MTPLADGPPARRLAVLVADPDPDTADSLAALLRLRGHTPAVARTAADAVAAAATPPDAAVYSLALDRTGDLSAALRAVGQDRRPLLVAVTARTAARPASAAAADLVLLKPFDPAALLDTLDRFARLLGPGRPPAAGGRPVRVLVASPYPVERIGVAALLAADPGVQVCGEADDGPEAVALARALAPDLAVVDSALPGPPAVAGLRRQRPGCRVLALCGRDDTLGVDRMVAAGAAGGVLKRAEGGALLRAVRAVAAGGAPDPPAADAPPAPAALSPQEEAVLRAVAGGYNNKEVAARMGLSIKTVETYKARAVKKAGLRTRADVVRYACRRGWLGADVPPLPAGPDAADRFPDGASADSRHP
jgi:DNA-binding NarL/FixJ family response regulator